MNTMFRYRVAVFGILLFALPFLGLGCKKTVEAQPVKLTYWRVFDAPDTFTDVIAAYRQAHPHVTIEYRKLRYEEFEREFVEALAEDRGPDIFSIHNTWIGKYRSKITPLPASTTLPYQYLTGTIKKEVATEMRTTPSITPAQIRSKFIDVVGQDVIRRGGKEGEKEEVYGLPLSVDTLVMFYNQDILNRAGIPTPPENWPDFVNDISKITRLDDKNNIALAGTALGAAKNIPRFSDIVSVLMMQNGAAMTDANGQPTFQMIPAQFKESGYNPGLEALQFYADFANPTKQSYSWNQDMPDAFEAFTAGQVAFFFGYAYHIPMIEARAPQLRWSVAEIPQTDVERNRVNFANYWVETVSKKTKHPNEAWSFVQFAASAQGAAPYLKAARKPTALRELIDQQKSDPLLGPFAESLLTARSWYRGNDVGAAEAAMAELVEGLPTALATEEPSRALGVLIRTAVAKISETLR